ncbi:MAG: hypothetical protein Q8R70_04995 [Methanoregula sp.]|nr:hypothetical protein [Methanoregula sp.]
MVYTAPTAKQFREEGGSLASKITTELGLIDAELDALIAEDTQDESKFVVLTAGVGTPAALATAGLDLASGADIFVYGAFFAPVDIQIVKMHDLLTEAYVKDTNDAKIEIYNNAGGPVKLFGRTLTAAGEAVGASHHTDPEAGTGNVTAGTRIDLKAVHTENGSGTGHAVVILEYKENH